MEQDIKKTEQKEKLDFSSRDDFEKAIEILKNEKFKMRTVQISYPENYKDLGIRSHILFYGKKKNAMNVLKFSMNQNWPILSLSKIWRLFSNGETRCPYWKLTFLKK